jgi:peptidyl-dipeptidase Dcp
MKKTILTAALMTTTLVSCQNNTTRNPLTADFDTPFGVPPFEQIAVGDYRPAFDEAIRRARAEVDAITSNPAAADFENTIAALDRNGEKLSEISAIFFNLNEAETSDTMQQIALEISPLLTEFSNDVQLDPELFRRVKAVYDQRANLTLTREQEILLEDTYRGFIRSGAGLGEADQARYREISTELSDLTLRFGQNVLAATNAYSLHLTDSADLAGLPAMIVEAAAAEAAARSLTGWVITLQAPSMGPFLQYSERRELREQVWRAYNTRGLAPGSDNTGIIKRIAELRLELARLMGFATYADYALEDKMAGTSGAVWEFLNGLTEKAMPYARKDVETIAAYARQQGLPDGLMSWDWGYYSEKYKSEHFSINDEMIRPYFKLENVQKGAFLLANKLYGLEFRENTGLPRYHPDVKGYEVWDGERLMAILYVDYFPRDSKRGGAWMTSFREQYRNADGSDVRPIVSLVCNFTKPTASTPSLLTFDEASTLLHEFGHGLHGMLADGNYVSLTGTSVYRDFVELPSQILENWMTEKDFLDLWAEHYETGEKIPQELVDRIVASQQYLSGYLNSRQLTYGTLDMAWHSLTEPYTGDVIDFERRAAEPTRMLPAVAGTAMSPGFGHIFSGGYAAGYYGYLWAEVLDADAFAYFVEQGIFNTEVARKFRDNILSQGGSERPMELYKRFRGHEPTMDAFLEREGLK